ncbi:hypothetical protein L1049_004061 [Liquidambar formosana]|uniref:Uncharacterized protein n=1 Tax=Liquidambar formosana TaxID=63359 RepID=A0AAP0WVR1_LIQFO
MKKSSMSPPYHSAQNNLRGTRKRRGKKFQREERDEVPCHGGKAGGGQEAGEHAVGRYKPKRRCIHQEIQAAATHTTA